MKIIDFGKYSQRHERIRVYKQLGAMFLLCLLLFQPANNITSQVKSMVQKKDTVRDNKAEIIKTDTALSGALNNLKELDKSIDKALKPKVIYKTRWLKSKTDTVIMYVPMPDSLNVPNYFDYKVDVPDTVFIHVTDTIKIKEKSWIRKQLDKL